MVRERGLRVLGQRQKMLEPALQSGGRPRLTCYSPCTQSISFPDGTFRYHFTLPDGDFAIPIIARSPDGVEERTATLSFVRGTTRTGA